MTPQTSSTPPRQLKRVLIANRGEIAVRIISTLRKLGIESVAVYTKPDAHARHVYEADHAVSLATSDTDGSYLDISAILAAANSCAATAIHPGYGFLSENAEFVQACARAGLIFIGPSAEAVAIMGDKIRAKQAVSAAGVPVVPGRLDQSMTDAHILSAATDIGFPVLLKPAAGGGGKGMHIAGSADELTSILPGARREALLSFGDDTMFVEKLIARPRHIEVQILADTFGNTIHLGERECSLQRRHQKVIEEAPSPFIDDDTRQRLGAAAVATAGSVGYVGAGTVEFIVSAEDPTTFFFMEMNTRLQVEHPVTEMIAGIDLVACQLAIAAGQPLSVSQTDIVLTGHAVEARVYAEQPALGFVPATGSILSLIEPAGDGIRVDSSLSIGTQIGTSYDPMLAKVIAWAPDRGSALRKLDAALGRTTILGVETNIGFLRKLLTATDVEAGYLDTDFIERNLPDLVDDQLPPPAYIAWAIAQLAAVTNVPGHISGQPWTSPSGWRSHGSAVSRWRLGCFGYPNVEISLGLHTWQRGVFTGEASIADAQVQPISGHLAEDRSQLDLVLAGQRMRMRLVETAAERWISLNGQGFRIHEVVHSTAKTASTHGAEIRSPMPGTVTAVPATVGQLVQVGDPLVVVEAMKMEHTLRAKIAGVVMGPLPQLGQQVVVNQLLASVNPETGP